MDQCRDIFFTRNCPQPLKKILVNQDLEKLLEIDTILVQNSNPIKVNVPIKVKEVQKSPFPSQTTITKIVNKYVPEAKNKDCIQIPVKNKCEQNDAAKFQQIITSNEKFICQFVKSDVKHPEYDTNMSLKLDNFLRTSAPLNRFSWQLMQKLNISRSTYRQQFLRINGVRYLLSGSLGGKTNEIQFNTLTRKKKKVKKLEIIEQKKPVEIPKVQKRLLLSHINYNLKPGPLSKKPLLNQSHRSLGDIQVMKLPRVELEISPTIGTQLDTNVCKRLKFVRDKDGLIDAPWAKFATSIIRPQTPDQMKTSHSFTIPYENNRCRVLMRKDTDTNLKSNALKRKRDDCSYDLIDSELSFLDNFDSKDDVEVIVKQIVSDLLQCICIEEIQDDVLFYDPEFKEKNDILSNGTINNHKKRKIGKRYVNELKKLDVTVIEIDFDQKETKEKCDKDFCKLGCVCSSLQTNYRINNHCGLPECMFDCKCNLEDSVIEFCKSEESVDISQSAVANLQHQMNRHLSKEEKKFQRTVIRSNNQTILLGAKRRGVRLPKRFEDYCNDFKDELFNEKSVNLVQIESGPTVKLHRLPPLSCEPWCMVHNLYRCFCKGAFLEGSTFNYSNTKSTQECLNILESTTSMPKVEDVVLTDEDTCARTTYKPELSNRTESKKILYIDRNQKIFITESRNNAKKKLLSRKIHECATNLNINTYAQAETKNKILKINNGITKSVGMRNFLKKKESEHYKEIIQKNSEMVSNILKSKVSIPIRPPKVDDFNVKSLHSVTSEFLLEEIFVWITTQAPYKQFITLKNAINCPILCANIRSAPNKVLELHPPFVKEIASLSVSKDTYVILIGKSFAWEIAATMKPKIHNSIQNMNTKKIAIEEKPLELQQHWYIVFIGEDFESLNVNSMQFSITKASVLQTVSGAQMRNRFIRFLSKTPVQNTPFQFGLYASPYQQEKCAFLGPYDSETNHGIELVGHNPDYKPSSGLWLNSKTHHRLHSILSFLSTQKNKSNVEPLTAPKFHIFPEIKNHKSDDSLTAILNVSALKPYSISLCYELKKRLIKKTKIISIAPVRKSRESVSSDSSHCNNGKREESDLNMLSLNKSVPNQVDEDVIFMPNDEEVVEISDSE